MEKEPQNSTQQASEPGKTLSDDLDKSEVEASQSDQEPSVGDEEVPAEQEQEESDSKLKGILSMKVPVIVKVAEKKLPIGSIINLNIGSIMQFDNDAYQHIELMVNNSTIGLGQPVKIGENFGLKITQIGDLNETIKSLGGNSGG